MKPFILKQDEKNKDNLVELREKDLKNVAGGITKLETVTVGKNSNKLDPGDAE